MLKSFFFIPATIKEFANKAQKIDADYLVVDFEESVREDQFNEVLNIVSKDLVHFNLINKKIFVRPRMRWDDGTFLLKQFDALFSLGLRNFVLPKIESEENLALIAHLVQYKIKECTFILSIESPVALINIEKLINNQHFKFWGLIFGSHDFCAYSGIEHTFKNISTARFLISTHASASNLFAIDVASVNTFDTDAFRKELIAAHEFGYNAKALLHPKQLLWFKDFKREFRIDKKREAKEIIDFYYKNGEPLIFNFRGQIYERLHLKKLMNLLNDPET